MLNIRLPSIPKLVIILMVFLISAKILKVTSVTDLTTIGFLLIPDKKIGWRHSLGNRGHYVGKEFKTYCMFNTVGWRDYEIEYEKQKGTFRIIALGDAFTEALQVPLANTFLKLLEVKLNAGGKRKFEVVNMGCSGYGTLQEYLCLKEFGEKYKPDTVIVFFVADDVCDNLPSLARLWQKEHILVQPKEDIKNLVNKKGIKWDIPLSVFEEEPLKLTEGMGESVFHKMYKKIFPRNDLSPSKGKPQRGIPIPWYNYSLSNEHSEAWTTAWKNTEALLIKIKEGASKLDASLLVVYLPSPEEVYANRWNEALETYPDMKLLSWDLERPSKILAKLCEDNGIKMLSLLPEFRNNFERQKDGSRYHYYYDGHFNVAGHELTSELLHEYLIGMLTTELKQL